MRILLTSQFSPWGPYSGGGQRSTHNLAAALADRGHEVTALFCRPPWESVRVPHALSYRVHWAPLWAVRSRSGALLRPLVARGVASRVERLLRLGVEVVHSSGDEGARIGPLRPRHRFAFVVTPRFPSYPDDLHASRGTFSVAYLRHNRYHLLGTALAAADTWCPTSQSSASQVRTAFGLGSANEQVIPNGVHPCFRTVPARDRKAGPLVFFGRLNWEKGLWVLGDALRIIATRRPGLLPECVFVGRGPGLRELRRRVDPLGLRLKFQHWLAPEELAQLLSGARLAVLPSLEESFGNTVVESMATGTPLVSTTAGSIPELVEHERTGLLVAPDDAVALAAGIERLLDEPAFAAQLGDSARKDVSARFSWEAVAEQYEGVYENALRLQRGAAE